MMTVRKFYLSFKSGNEIDTMVYKLYDLTADEIKSVESI